MITYGGRVLASNVLVGVEPIIATHIILGLNVVYDAVIDGYGEPSTVNRFHSPYIVDEMVAVNPGVITTDQVQEIIFNGQATQVARYMANNVALASFRTDDKFSSQFNILTVSTDSKWSAASIVAPTNAYMFTNDGYLLATNSIARTFLAGVNLDGVAQNDILALPFTIHGAGALTSPVTVSITFFNSGGSVVYAGQLIDNGGAYKFAHDTDFNYGYGLVDGRGRPIPFVFQIRINSVGNYQDLFSKKTTSCRISFTSAQALTFAFGSAKITPDSEGYTSRTTVAFKRLTEVLYKTDYEAYVNAEYRLGGV